MATQTKKFDEVVSAVVASEATKKNQHNIFHTWDGWVSKDVLHVTSRSGARRRNIWHFGVEKNAGRNMFFKNTTGTADCWTMSAGENALERAVLAMNPHAKVEYVDEINHMLQRRGSQCSHSTSRGGYWWYITTDGQQEVVREADVVEHHSNQYHIGCPIGSDEVLVTGGTYAVNWSNKHQISKVYVARGADMESITLQIKVQDELWRMMDYDDRLQDPWWDDDVTIENYKNRRLELLELAAQGKLQPAFVKRLTHSAKPYQELAREVPQELYDRAMFHHPDNHRRRELTDRIVQMISDSKTFDFRLTESNQAGEMIFVLPKGDNIDWDDNQFDTKLSDWGSCSSCGHAVDKNSSRYVDSLPEWAAESIAKQCAETPLFELEHLPDNIAMANDLVIAIYQEKRKKYWSDVHEMYILLKNGKNPNTGFGRVHWNAWYRS